MAIETDADRLELLMTLGEQVDFSEGQDTWGVYGVLERLYVEVGEIESHQPVITCRAIDTIVHPTRIVEHGTVLQAASGGYSVVSIQPDGDGMVAIVLQKI